MKRVRLKDLIELKTETISPKKNDNYFLYSLPSFDNNKNREYLKGGKIQSNKYKVPNRSILFNKLNVRFKRVWKIDNTDNNKICSTEFLPLVVDENKAYYNFCYYLLISENITNFLCNQNANTSGSHKRIDASMLLELEINLPPLETQQKIAKILSDIDDKIEVLHQINDNLSELAKTIYDYWFVQFDFPDENGKPYKTSGGKMVYNDILKREIPEGWEVKKLGDVAQFKNGINYEKTSSGSEKVKIINVRNISSSTIFINQTDLDEIFLENDRSTNFLVNDKMILITRSGIPGATRLVSVLEAKTVYSGFIIASEVNDLIFKNLIFYYLKNIEEVLKNQSAGTIMKNISQSVLTEMRISFPPQNVLLKFNTIIHNLLEQMKNVQKQNQELQSLRDWLLPMLMNGQISVE